MSHTISSWAALSSVHQPSQLASTLSRGVGHGPDSTVTSVHAYVIDRHGSNERQLAALPVGSFLPTWSADGLHLAYSGDGTYVVDLDGTGFRLVSAHPTPPAQWRP